MRTCARLSTTTVPPSVARPNRPRAYHAGHVVLPPPSRAARRRADHNRQQRLKKTVPRAAKKKKKNPRKARHGRAGKRGGVEKTQIERAAECVIKLGREDGGAQRMVLICRTALDPGGPLYRVYGRCPRTICSPFAGGGLQKEEI